MWYKTWNSLTSKTLLRDILAWCCRVFYVDSEIAWRWILESRDENLAPTESKCGIVWLQKFHLLPVLWALRGFTSLIRDNFWGIRHCKGRPVRFFSRCLSYDRWWKAWQEFRSYPKDSFANKILPIFQRDYLRYIRERTRDREKKLVA